MRELTVDPCESRIDVSLIPDSVGRSLAQAALPGIYKFYSDPANVAKFEEWKKQREEVKKRG